MLTFQHSPPIYVERKIHVHACIPDDQSPCDLSKNGAEKGSPKASVTVSNLVDVKYHPDSQRQSAPERNSYNRITSNTIPADPPQGVLMHLRIGCHSGSIIPSTHHYKFV